MRAYKPVPVELDGKLYAVHPDRTVYLVTPYGNRRVKSNTTRAAVFQEWFFLYTPQGKEARANQLKGLEEGA